MWKLRNFIATILLQKFRESVLLKNFIWFDEKNVRNSEFLVLPHCAIVEKQDNYSYINISSNKLFSNFFSKYVAFTEFFAK